MSHGAITQFRRQYLAILRRCATLNAMGWMACGLGAGGMALLTPVEAQAQGIVTDGRTATTVSGAGTANVTIDTGTVKGVNAFNSFSQFNVSGGQTVNLNLPTGTANLLNLVRNNASQIDGIVNAYKDGRIGGNVFFFNPHGFVVGAGGQMNVGSLLMATPTSAFMDKLVGAGGAIDDAAVADALAGRIPLTTSGLITVQGRIRAADGALLQANRVEISGAGQVRSGAAARNELAALGQLVNVSGLSAGGATFVQDGSVLIVAEDDIRLGNSIYTDGADYHLTANNRIVVGEDVVISTRDVADPANADHETAASEGDSGDLKLLASHIELQRGSKLLAHADNGHTAGDVTVLARDIDAIGAVREADASIQIDRATIRGRDILIRSEADTSAIAVLLAQNPGTTLDEAQKFVNNEIDSLSDGPGGEFLAVTTKATARTEVLGSRIAGSRDVTVEALAAARAGFEKDAFAELLIHDAPAAGGQPAVATVISGRNVTLRAEASTSYTLNVLGSVMKLADQSWLPSDDATLKAFNDQLFDFSSVPLVSLSKAKGTVQLDDHTVVNATGDLTVKADAISAAKPTFASPILFSAAWAESTAEASTKVQGQTELNAGGAAKVQASTDVEVNVTATVNSTNKPIDAVFVYADNSATTTAETGAGTRIRAGSVEVSAANTSDLSVSGTAANSGGSGVGIAVAVNLSENKVTAKLGGDVASTSGDVDVKASIDMAKNGTAADASTLGNPNTISAKITNFQAGIQRNVTSGILGATGKLSSATADKVSGFLFPGIKEGKFNLSGAVSYNDSLNVARASVADGATVSSARDVNVLADVKDRPTSTVGAKSTSTGTAIGGAVALGNFDNQAQAWIGKSAKVDAKRATKVDAQTRIPFAWQIDWSSPDQILNHLQGSVLDLVFTSFGINSASGKSGAGVAAAVTVFDMKNSAQAWVDEGAQLNTVFTPGSAGTSGQSVTVHAKNDINTVHAVGIAGKKFLGTTGGKAAVGGSANVLDLDTTATALIHGGADVRATQGVNVQAEQTTQIVSVAEAGGQSDNVGVEGAVGVHLIKQRTEAGIDDDVRVQAGGPVTVQANGDLEDITVAGGVVATKGQVGIGFAVSVNQVDTDTKAIIGNVDAAGADAAGVQGSVRSGGAVTVQATSGTEVGAYSVAGSIATNSKAQTDAPAAGDSSTQSGSSGAGTGKFGIAVSADAAYNEITADTTAAITDGANIAQGTNVAVTATNDLALNALAGAVTISTQSNGNGLAGSFAYNQLGGATSAYIDGATLRNTGTTKVEATVTGEIKTLSASVQASRGKLGVAGSVSINEIAHATQAFLRGSDVSGTSGVTLSARDSAAIKSVAGAIAFGGKAGIGLSFGWNHIDNRISAFMAGSDVNTTGAVTVSALSNASIDTVAASLGASSGQMAGAAAVAINQIDTQTTARVEGQKTAAGLDAASLSVSASDESDINSIVGALGLSAGKAGFGVSFAWNDIGSQVHASLVAPNVSTTGLTSVSATHDGDIETYAMAGGGAAKVGASGSLAINDITTQLSATTQGGRVTASAVNVKAQERARIFAATGALSGGGTAAVGASGSYNHLSGTVLAQVAGGQVSAQSGSVTVQALREGEVEVWAASGSGGGTAGFAGSIAINDIGGSTKARFSDGAQVQASDNVKVVAEADDRIEARAGTVALGGTVGGGGAIAINDVRNATTAEITGSGTSVNALAKGSDTISVDNGSLASSGSTLDARQQKDALQGTAVVASSTSEVETILANVSGGGKVGVAASVSVNMLSGSTTAQVKDGASVQADATGAESAQQARVGAYHHDDVTAGVGGVGVGGAVGVGGSVDTTILSHQTLAQVQSATVAARNQVAVKAAHTAATQQIVVGAGGGGAASLSLSGNVLLAKMNTQALVDGGTLRSTGGNVTVQADSVLAAEHIAGGLSASGAVSVGATAVVTLVEQQTRAATLGNSVIDAAGQTRVEANSEQDVDVKAATGSVSGGAGIAGTVAVTVLKGQTDAAIGGGTRLNQNIVSTAEAQSVSVKATDTTTVDNKLGSLGVGITTGGIGATADVILANSSTSATIASGAKVRAGGDVKVEADTRRDLTSLTVAFSGGATFGISGAVSYIGAGGRASSDAQSELMGSVNEANRVSSGGLFGDQASSDAGGTSASTQRADAARSGMNLGRDLTGVPAGTSALARVGSGAEVVSGRDAIVKASTSTDVDAHAIGAAVSGGLSIGGGIAIANVADKTLAQVAGTVTAARNVRIQSSDGGAGQSLLQTKAGGGGLVGLGASVTIFDRTSSSTAEVAADAVITATGTATADPSAGTGQVVVDAGSEHHLKSQALGAAAGLGAVGAAIAHVDNQATTTASVGDRARITAKGIDVNGHSVTDAQAEATAAAGGIVSGAGADARANDQHTAMASVGAGAVLDATGGLNQVRASIDPHARAETFGVAVSAGVSVGLSMAEATVRGAALSQVGNTVQLKGQDIFVKANTLQTGAPTAKAKAQAVAGGTLLGAGATSAEADVQTTTQASLGQGVVATATRDLGVLANSVTSGDTAASGVYLGLIAGGSNEALTKADTTTTAKVDQGVNLSATRALSVNATGSDTLRADTEAGAGGLGALLASKAETRAEAHTNAALGSLTASGGQATAGSVQVNATQTTNFNATADSLNASVVGYSGARAVNTVDTDTRADIGLGMTVTASNGNVQAKAVNHVVKQALASGQFNVDSASGGLLNGAAARSQSLIRNRAHVGVGAGSNVTVNIPGSTYGQIELGALNHVDAHDSVRLDSGGAIAIARSESEIRNDLNRAEVLIGGNAQLKTDGEVNVSARTDAKVFTEARSKTYGLAGAAQGETLSRIAADNVVDVAAGAVIEGQRDVHLMAGTDRSNANLLQADADTRLWNRTAVPIETDPEAHAEVVQSNRVNVAQGAQVRSVRSVHLTATEGDHRTRGFGEGTDAYREVLSAIGEFFGADTSALKISGGSTWDNTRDPNAITSSVNVDGKVEAGIWHLQHLTYRADGTFSTSEGVSFTTRDDVKLADLLTAEIDKLRQKADDVRKAADNYSGDTNAADVALALDNDADILEAQLAAMGGNTRVGFIDVNPILATTGNVNVTSRVLTGAASGQLIAPGDVRIDIDNQSTRFMTTSTLTIPDEDGGQVLWNGQRVSSAAQINARNRAGLSTAVTVVDALSTPAPVISVLNSNSNDTATGAPAQLWIQGDISNLGGLAKAKSHGTIRASANISAETVDIATGGDFIKTYTPGFTHQGGDPIAQLGSVPGSRETAAMGLTGSDAADSASGDYVNNSLPGDCLTVSCGSTIAGNNVYISAEKLNINGLIQAGLPMRSVKVTQALITAKASDIAQARIKYLAGTGDRYLDLTNPEPGSAEIKVRYDAANDRLELDNVRIGGGHMELFGNIFSTGNGELRVLDGYGRIDIGNETAYDIALGRVDTGQGVEGKIRITDTAKRVIGVGQVDATGARTDGKPLVTEITRLGNQIQIRDSRTVDADGKPTYVAGTATGDATTYDPAANRRFNWINGRTTTFQETRTHVSRSVFSIDELVPDYDSFTPGTVTAQTPVQRLSGDWLSSGENNVATPGYKMNFTQATTAPEFKEPMRVSVYCPIGCAIYKEATFSADYEWKVSEYFHHSLNASKEIKVNFVGYDQSQVNVTSNTGKVLLGGLVRSLTGAANITATNGIQQINDQAVVNARTVNLSALTGAIGSATQAVHVNLTDADASRGLVNGTLTASARDGIAIRETDGDLRIAAAEAAAGALRLSADGSILATDPSVTLKGRDVRLSSDSGRIGSAASPLRIDTDAVMGVLSAQALDDIHLREVSGDLRVEQVASTLGDVHLSVPGGSLRDANDVEVVDPLQASELLALWDTMRLREGSYQGSADQTVRNAERLVESEYQRYWQLRNVRSDGAGGYTADAFDPAYTFRLSAAQASQLKQVNQWTDADVAAYEQQQTAAFRAANARFGGQAYNANFKYKASDAEVAALTDGVKWSDAQLANAIGAGLFRPVADTEVRVEAANIVGRNLVLDVAGAIGEDAGVVRIARNGGAASLTPEQKLALLTAELQDMTVTDTEVVIAQKKDIDVEASGTLNAKATGPIFLGSEGDLALQSVASTQEVRIKSGSGLSNAAADGVAAVQAGALVLEAGQGSIGSATKTMLVDVADGGRTTARARQHIWLTEATGDMNVGTVYAQQSATLTAPGAILDGRNDRQLDVQAREINLIAGTTIGRDGGINESLEVSTGVNGVLNASAPDGIFLAGMGQSSKLGNITTAGRFAYDALASNLILTGRVQARSMRLGADDDIVFQQGGKLVAVERIDLAAGIDGQGSVVVDPAVTASPLVSAPVVRISAADTVGEGQPLSIDSPDVGFAARGINARVSTPGAMLVNVGGSGGLPAENVSLDVDAGESVTFAQLNAEHSQVRSLTQAPVTVEQGLVTNWAEFFTPFYSVRIDAADRRAQQGWDVHGFTLDGAYDMALTPQAAFIGAYVLVGNPEKVIFSNPSGVVTGETRTVGDLGGQREQVASRTLTVVRNVQGNLAPAAGLLQVSGDPFDCEGHEAECRELGLGAPAAGE
ncbi:MAG: hypothetical protein A2711_04465 [Burkholderiales bacterium RIFCSPHIGHO2_01_FULL_63_240]|nr:MAG: hypothetical protein A2711_04465 [Burkholderiales bacterium RIFCSPHIGHO2_01_FULL_63_240]